MKKYSTPTDPKHKNMYMRLKHYLYLIILLDVQKAQKLKMYQKH